MTGKRGWVGALAGALLLAGCSGANPSASPSSGAAWAHEAQEWLAAFDAASAFGEASTAAFSEGPAPQAGFYAVDVDFDSSDFVGFHKIGRWNALATMQSYGSLADELVRGPLYLDTDGIVSTETITWKDGSSTGYLAELSIGPAGIEHLVHAGDYWLAPPDAAGNPDLAAVQRTTDEIAALYADAWSSTEPDALGALYAPEAKVVDTLGRLDLAGIAAISAWVNPRSSRVRLDQIGEVYPVRAIESSADPGASTRPAAAYHRDGHNVSAPAMVWLFAESIERCPGAMVVRLTLDDNRKVVAERRFHRIDSERACSTSSTLPSGWWTSRSAPLPVGRQPSGHLDTASGRVQLYGGTPLLSTLTANALKAFDRAGLTAPAVRSIAFDPYTEQCVSQDGSITWNRAGTDVLMCTDGSEILDAKPVCRDGFTAPCITSLADVRHVLMHELAHAWLAADIGPVEQSAFLHAVGLTGWNDSGLPWRKRGAEWAAETLTWALNAESKTPARIGSPPCSVLAAGFVALTGKQPPRGCGT